MTLIMNLKAVVLAAGFADDEIVVVAAGFADDEIVVIAAGSDYDKAEDCCCCCWFC